MWVHDSIQKKKLLEYKEYIVEKNYTDMLVDSRKRKYKDFNFDSDEIMNSTDKIKSNKPTSLMTWKIIPTLWKAQDPTQMKQSFLNFYKIQLLMRKESIKGNRNNDKNSLRKDKKIKNSKIFTKFNS